MIELKLKNVSTPLYSPFRGLGGRGLIFTTIFYDGKTVKLLPKIIPLSLLRTHNHISNPVPAYI